LLNAVEGIRDARDGRAFTETVVQQAIERDLTLERGQCPFIERELENPRIAGLLMPPQPGFAVSAGPKPFDQLPL